MNNTPDKTDAKANKGHYHEKQQKRVIRDCANEGADPAYGGRDDGRNGCENRGNGDSGSSMKAFLQSSYINNSLEQAYYHEQKSGADEVTHRLGHKKVRQLGKEPEAEVFHLRHRTAPPKRNKQNTMSASRTKEHIHTWSGKACRT
ncbi:MAG: hypothetical protein [Inoviridae sp.]|nr:MAG: hypothetical protein [Inoviridae sp.]